MPIVSDFYQVKLFCKLVPQISVTIRHYQITAMTAILPTEQQLADAISTSLGGPLKVMIASAAAYYGVQTEKLGAGGWVTQATSKVAAGLGGAAGDPLPSQTAGLITLKTASAGRQNRGRAYVPFPAEGDNTWLSGIPTPGGTYITAGDLLGDKFVSAVVTTVGAGAGTVTLTGQVYHRAIGSFTTLTSRTTQARWATQRRRGSYGRPNVDPF